MVDIKFSSALSGYDGAEFSRAWINCDTSMAATYSGEVLGMLKW